MGKLDGYKIITAGLVGITTCAGMVLGSVKSYADDTVTDDTSITVPVSCSMTGTINTAHTATIDPGTWSGASGSALADGIGKTTLTTFCNDNNGFSVYAVGYTGDVEGTNTLVGANTDLAINTGVYSSGDTTSSWSMKVDKVDNPAQGDPITWNPQYMTIQEDIEGYFNTWHTVPDDYTKVAEYKATTTGTSSTTDQALGAKLETTYAAFISPTQAADTYTGKVKYVMVHPYNHVAPELPVQLPDPPTSCNNPITGITYMQDINSNNKSTVLASLTEETPYYIYDNRDNEVYCVSKLEDGNLWLLDNLRLDLNDADVVANVTASNTNASATSLDYMKNGGGTTSDQYPTAPINSVVWDGEDYYSIPITVSTYKDEVYNTEENIGNGSQKAGVYYNYCAASAGSYCYGNGTNYGTSVSNATEDICPANWRMPTGGSAGASNEYDNLAIALGLTSEPRNVWGIDVDYYSGNDYQTALSTQATGMAYPYPDYSEGQGYFWSSTRHDNEFMYTLSIFLINDPGVYTSKLYLDRYFGASVRCLLQ